MQKISVWPLRSIWSKRGHVFQRIKNSTLVLHKIPKGTFIPSLVEIWPSCFREEEFWKVVHDDDGCQVLTIAHLALRASWAEKLLHL